jgi:positive regulator of sigma E activity
MQASAPASEPAPAPALEEPKPTDGVKVNLDWNAMGTASIVYIVVVLVFVLIYSLGAAKLSYDHFQSVLWGVLAFIFAPFYYPYYAFMYSSPAAPSMFGGRKRMSKLLW